MNIIEFKNGQEPALNAETLNILQRKMLDLAHPVGSYYWSSVSTNPATLFGGTWEQVNDKFVLAAGSTYTAGQTGGEATHTLITSEIPSHTHGSKTLTGSFKTSDNILVNMSEVNTLVGVSGICSTSSISHTECVGNTLSQATKTSHTQVNITATHEHTAVGGGAAHNNMPPYEVAYCWKRTA